MTSCNIVDYENKELIYIFDLEVEKYELFTSYKSITYI